METYIWKKEVKSLYKNADPTRCAQELYSLGDAFTPQQVVDFATDEETELHKCFEWQDSKAANEYRKQQARMLTKNLIVIRHEPETDTINVIREIPIAYRTVESESYQTTTYILEHDGERKKLLKTAIKELRSYEKKYETLTELNSVFAAMETALGQLE